MESNSNLEWGDLRSALAETRMSKGSVVPLYFKVHTNEQIYSHSNQSTDATVSTNANDYVIKGEVAKPGWVQMGGGVYSSRAYHECYGVD